MTFQLIQSKAKVPSTWKYFHQYFQKNPFFVSHYSSTYSIGLSALAIFPIIITVFWTKGHSRRGSQWSGNLPKLWTSLYQFKSANRHMIALLRRTLINAFVSVVQVCIPPNVRVQHDGFCIMVTACWVKRSTRRVLLIERRWLLRKINLTITVTVLLIPTLLWVRILGAVLRYYYLPG